MIKIIYCTNHFKEYIWKVIRQNVSNWNLRRKTSTFEVFGNRSDDVGAELCENTNPSISLAWMRVNEAKMHCRLWPREHSWVKNKDLFLRMKRAQKHHPTFSGDSRVIKKLWAIVETSLLSWMAIIKTHTVSVLWSFVVNEPVIQYQPQLSLGDRIIVHRYAFLISAVDG